MKEDDLLRAHQIGEVIDILQTTTHHLYDPDQLLTVRMFASFDANLLSCGNFLVIVGTY